MAHGIASGPLRFVQFYEKNANLDPPEDAAPLPCGIPYEFRRASQAYVLNRYSRISVAQPQENE